MLDQTLSLSQLLSIGVFVAVLLLEILFPFRKYLFRLRHFGRNAVLGIANTVVMGLFGATANVWVFL